MDKSNTEVEVVEFNIDNILLGKFATKGSGSSKGRFTMYTSYRLLKESGIELSKKQTELIDRTQYKWNYWKITDDAKGTIIISLHKKDINVWSYVVINFDGTYASFNSITDAKNSIK